MRSVILFLLFPFFSYTQGIVSGKVVDSSTGTPIPYAFIGLIKQNAGTNANSNGEFRFNCLQPELDTIVISNIGYTTVRMPVRDLLPNQVIRLATFEKRLRPVVIKNQWASSEVGGYKKFQDYCLTTVGYQWQVAKKLTAPVANAMLQSVKIGVSKNQKGVSTFRVHVFDADPATNGPGDELTDSVIQVAVKPGMITIDLTPYQVWLPQKEFFISVEWLRIPSNEYHFKAKFEGKDTAFMNYNPCLCFTKDAPSAPNEIWSLTYSGKWGSMRRHEKSYSLAISATVKY